MTNMYSGCLNQIVNCYDCDWHYENNKNGLALGKKHHNKTGHEVSIEITYSITYTNQIRG